MAVSGPREGRGMADSSRRFAGKAAGGGEYGFVKS